MFVPIDYLKPILADLISQGRSSEPRKPWLGFHVEETMGRYRYFRLRPRRTADYVAFGAFVFLKSPF
jgi:hypothetical protein